MKYISKVVAYIGGLFDSYARARAAEELARHGHYEAAKRLIANQPILSK